MGNRLDLHSELLTLCPNVYFQPPSNIAIIYPCIVYRMSDKMRLYGSNVVHFKRQEYQITVIDRNPESNIPNRVEEHFQYCGINQYYMSDNLNHTVLSLHY